MDDWLAAQLRQADHERDRRNQEQSDLASRQVWDYWNDPRNGLTARMAREDDENARRRQELAAQDAVRLDRFDERPVVEWDRLDLGWTEPSETASRRELLLVGPDGPDRFEPPTPDSTPRRDDGDRYRPEPDRPRPQQDGDRFDPPQPPTPLRSDDDRFEPTPQPARPRRDGDAFGAASDRERELDAARREVAALSVPDRRDLLCTADDRDRASTYADERATRGAESAAEAVGEVDRQWNHPLYGLWARMRRDADYQDRYKAELDAEEARRLDRDTFGDLVDPDPVTYRSVAEAAAEARRSGLEDPAAGRTGWFRHNRAASVRAATGVERGTMESAHGLPQVMGKLIDGYSPGRSLTTLLAAAGGGVHDQFDRRWDAERRKLGAAADDLTAGAAYDMLCRAINEIAEPAPGAPPDDHTLSARAKGTLAWRIHEEMFTDLGLDPQQRLRDQRIADDTYRNGR